jgi:hypothetical protein
MNLDIKLLVEKYTQIYEMYSHEYSDINIDKLSLYDSLILAHEMEYKAQHLQNIKPKLKIQFLPILQKIYIRYRNIALTSLLRWDVWHFFNPDGIHHAWYVPFITDILYRNREQNIFPITSKYISKKGLKISDAENQIFKYKGEFIDPNKWWHGKIDKDLETIFKQEFFTPELIKCLNQDRENILSNENFNKTDKYIFKNIVKSEKLLNDRTNETDFDKIMFVITFTLNVVHYSETIFSYGDYNDTHNGLNQSQLDQLSNLDTRQWDKEIEKEMDFGK